MSGVGRLMALTLAQGAQMVADPGFQARIRDAMVRAAIAVSTEPIGLFTPTVWQKRRQCAVQIIGNPDSKLPSFLAAVASDPNNSLTWFAPVEIASSTGANPVVVTTTAAHGYVNGDVVEIIGHLVNTQANGVWSVTNLTSTTFSIPTDGNGTGTATGMAMKEIIDSDLAFTVNSVFSAVAGILTTD
jgi:hypothetical protein